MNMILNYETGHSTEEEETNTFYNYSILYMFTDHRSFLVIHTHYNYKYMCIQANNTHRFVELLVFI